MPMYASGPPVFGRRFFGREHVRARASLHCVVASPGSMSADSAASLQSHIAHHSTRIKRTVCWRRRYNHGEHYTMGARELKPQHVEPPSEKRSKRAAFPTMHARAPPGQERLERGFETRQAVHVCTAHAILQACAICDLLPAAAAANLTLRNAGSENSQKRLKPPLLSRAQGPHELRRGSSTVESRMRSVMRIKEVVISCSAAILYGTVARDIRT
jgi:hypothetical protein